MSHRIVFHPDAVRELVDLHAFIKAQGGTRRADTFVEAIRDYCRGFSTFPERGSRRDDISEGLRVVGFRRRVSVAFRIDGDVVTILGVHYGGRNFGPSQLDEED